MRRLSFAILSSLFLMIGWAHNIAAQTPCADALTQAKKSYDLGLWEDISAQLEPCIKQRPSRATTIEVHSLLARAYLMSDEPEKARKEVSAILRLDSTFEGGQPPRF